jgi:hypothetical protein
MPAVTEVETGNTTREANTSLGEQVSDQTPLQPDYSQIPQAKVVDGRLIMPADWADDDGDGSTV